MNDYKLYHAPDDESQRASITTDLAAVHDSGDGSWKYGFVKRSKGLKDPWRLLFLLIFF